MPQLSELGMLQTGYQLRGAAQYEDAGTNLLIQQGDLRDDSIDLSRGFRMTLDRRSERDALQPGDLLLRGRGANYGAIVVSDIPPDAVAIAPIVVFRPYTYHRPSPDAVLPEYVAWFINRPATQAILNTAAHGTHIPTVSMRTFAELEIILPPLSVQAQIVEMTALMRRERWLTERLLDKREQVAQAFLENLLQQTGHL